MIRAFIHKVGYVLLGRENWLYLLAQLNLRRMYLSNYEIAFKMFAKRLPQHGLVLDIGANLGVMSAYLAQQNSFWKILAIEPIPSHIKVMTRLFRKKRLMNIAVVEKALSNQNGFFDMKVPVRNGVLKHGLASLEIHKDKIGEKHQVQAITLDELMENYSGEMLIGIKIDVENHEWEVLSGGIQTIRQHHPIIMAELWNDSKKERCLNVLTSLGYSAMYVNSKDELVSYQGEDVLDYIFIPPAV